MCFRSIHCMHGGMYHVHVCMPVHTHTMCILLTCLLAYMSVCMCSVCVFLCVYHHFKTIKWFFSLKSDACTLKLVARYLRVWIIFGMHAFPKNNYIWTYVNQLETENAYFAKLISSVDRAHDHRNRIWNDWYAESYCLLQYFTWMWKIMKLNTKLTLMLRMNERKWQQLQFQPSR